ncbi:MAG: protein-export chaperone SecB [Alphaproteobacteria bacterium CG_4_9_14_3_um_filter_47_13]|nr:MAG: protein-export chaperone SecB [Alphaproteobacteria bacterium CG_4_9_14_3_um_filter_47_13]
MTGESKIDKEHIDRESRGMPGPDIPENASSVDRLPVTIHAQYIKDLSFENPNAPMPLRKSDGKPALDVDFAMDAKKIEMEGYEEAYEVSLKVSANAKKGDMTTFIVELEYGMMVTVQDVPEDKVHPLLLIEMPNYLFPYVRQIISDMTQQAGYLPFLLTPVNFKALYRKRFGGPQVTSHGRAAEKEGAL